MLRNSERGATRAGRPPTDAFWGEKVGEVAEEHLDWGAGRIEGALGEIAAREERDDAPSLRVVGRLLKAHRKKTEAARALYRQFRWPDAMVMGLLPWEAAATIFENMRAYTLHGRGGRWGALPMSIRRCRWFWRVTLAIPDAPLDVRVSYAERFERAEESGDDTRRLMFEMLIDSDLYAAREQEEKPCADGTKEASTNAKTAAGRRQAAAEKLLRQDAASGRDEAHSGADGSPERGAPHRRAEDVRPVPRRVDRKREADAQAPHVGTLRKPDPHPRPAGDR